ncbi:MAG: AraD1 family protein [Elstera sp.]
MLLSQILTASGDRKVAARTPGSDARIVNGVSRIYDLAALAIAAGRGLEAQVAAQGLGDSVDLSTVTLLSPIEHSDAGHLHITGTGLTHLGSAAARDAMHKKLGDEEVLTDSMKMFKMGLEGGKPAAGQTGVQPEWFYKGTGSALIGPGAPLPSPDFALDGGEEPEIAGVYLIGADGTPFRLGFALGNEFSDHVTERQNYLYLAHSKLRPAAIGPELLIGDLPKDCRGTSRILRDGAVLWEKPFLSGEDNMSHTIANLEHHHFKYALFRQPGDVHVHLFGTATLSFADGITTRPGDVFEIAVPDFGLPLRNPLSIVPANTPAVKAL